jgi:hypothetical protein
MRDETRCPVSCPEGPSKRRSAHVSLVQRDRPEAAVSYVRRCRNAVRPAIGYRLANAAIAMTGTVSADGVWTQQRPAGAISSPSWEISCYSHHSLIEPLLKSVPAKCSPCFLAKLAAEMAPVARQVEGANKPPSTRLLPPRQAGIARLDNHQRRRTTGLPGHQFRRQSGAFHQHMQKKCISCVRFGRSAAYPLFGGSARHGGLS